MKIQIPFFVLLILTFASSLQASNTNSLSVEGYASDCYMFLASGSPAVRFQVYADAESAKADNQGNSTKASVENLLVDFGPGYQLMSIYPESKTLKICAIIRHYQGAKKLRFEFNENRILQLIADESLTIQSDAYALMSTEQQNIVKSLISAYLASENKLYQFQHQPEK